MTIRRIAIAVLVVATACAGDGDDPDAIAPASTGPSTTEAPPATNPPTTTNPTTTTVATTTTTTSTTSTTSAGTSSGTTATPATTAPACGTFSTDSVSVNFPMTLSSLVGADIRTGRHDCFDRVVVELGGTGELPGYRVAYADDPIRLSPSDLEVEIAGDATLVLSAGSWMTTMEGDGYDGPHQIVPDGPSAILELRLVENFEGMFAWAIGVDHSRPFRVSTLPDPPRIVVDIAT
jgi:hypothetical protein